jgi:hypothetical protein
MGLDAIPVTPPPSQGKIVFVGSAIGAPRSIFTMNFDSSARRLLPPRILRATPLGRLMDREIAFSDVDNTGGKTPRELRAGGGSERARCRDGMLCRGGRARTRFVFPTVSSRPG